jgi:hypothetical protein
MTKSEEEFAEPVRDRSKVPGSGPTQTAMWFVWVVIAD